MHPKLLITLLFATLIISLPKAQPVDSTTMASRQKQYNYYWEKHNKRARTGWILLGTGLASLPLGYYMLGQGFSEHSSVPIPVIYMVLAYNIGAPIASAPFFIRAGELKRKARLALTGESVSFGNKQLPNSGYVALSVAIPL